MVAERLQVRLKTSQLHRLQPCMFRRSHLQLAMSRAAGQSWKQDHSTGSTRSEYRVYRGSHQGLSNRAWAISEVKITFTIVSLVRFVSELGDIGQACARRPGKEFARVSSREAVATEQRVWNQQQRLTTSLC